MIRYTIKMQHDEKTFEALSRMQYDLFCSSNRITRTILSILLIAAGIVNFTQWWGILLAAYGCYLTTSTYSSANHTAHRLAEQIKNSGMPFPSSRYEFSDDHIEIYVLPAGKKEVSLRHPSPTDRSGMCRIRNGRYRRFCENRYEFHVKHRDPVRLFHLIFHIDVR